MSEDSFTIRTRRGEVKLRPATLEEIDEFVGRIAKKESMHVHAFDLVEQCATYPDRDALRALFKRMPELPNTIAEDLMCIAVGKAPVTGTLDEPTDVPQSVRDDAANAFEAMRISMKDEDIVEFATRAGPVFVRVPDSATYAKMRAETSENRARVLSIARAFCDRAIVWPKPHAAVLDRFPALAGQIAQDMMAVAGGRFAETGKVHAL